MTFGSLVKDNLRYFWRTNLAVAAGVAVAIGVLTGSLLVGDSVRGSLRELFLSRLGRTDDVLLASGFFREGLAEALGERAPVEAVHVIAFDAMVSHPSSGRRSSRVQIYGVDERFWVFHGAEAPEMSDREVLLSPALAEELGSAPGDAVLLRLERPTEVSAGSLYGVKENTASTLRLTVADGLEGTGLPEFSLSPSQEAARTAFLSLDRLQRELEQRGRANMVLVRWPGDRDVEALTGAVREAVVLEDLSVRVAPLEARGVVAVTSDALMLSEPLASAVSAVAEEMGAETTSVLTYLANTLRIGDREVPYSLVSAVDGEALRELAGVDVAETGIVLNDWAGSRLEAEPGDALTMDFYVWHDEGRIETDSTELTVEAVVPMEGLAADRDLAPDYPGISDTEDLSDWQPPFPIDLRRVDDDDETYWDDYRATPKAFVPLELGQRLWPVRQGKLTSIRIAASEGGDVTAFAEDVASRLRARLDPFDLGFQAMPAREEGLEASRGATDFGEYFVYFSYFLVVAALLLTGLFFKLGVEQRHREVGTLLATGFTLRRVRRLFLAEGTALSVLGALLGTGIALAYAAVILYGLRTWWVDAVGTRLLTLHVELPSLAGGLLGGIAAALFATWVTLRGLGKVPVRSLLAGETAPEGAGKKTLSRRGLGIAVAGLAASLGLVAGTLAGAVPEVAGFFGAGNLLLVALLAFQWVWLRAGGGRDVTGTGPLALGRLGFRNAAYRPGRTLVAVALIAFATFTIVAVEAFRKDDSVTQVERDSGSGGYALVAESLIALHWSPNTEEGRNAYNLPYPGEPDAVDMAIQTFRLRPGDDASCLNLYRPQNPRLLAPTGDFFEEGRFRFAATLAETPEERANPWRLLERRYEDGAVPVIGDANSMTYVLHLGLGEDFALPRVGQEPLTLRLVATLADSVFQGELLLSEERFLEHFPGVDGFRYFLVDVPMESAERASALLEERLSDYGLDARTTAEKLAGFHRVENTYLSTFQSLGGLGLVLGTFGLAAILLRNVLERRRELGLLRAVGYRGRDFSLMIFAENALVLVFGLATGALSAVVAIAPAWLSRGGSFGAGTLVWLLGAVLAAGLLASAVAVYATLRTPLLASLRAE